MKKSIIQIKLLWCLAMLPWTSMAQDSIGHIEKLDTIYANEQNSVALFFSNPIQQGIAGSENFVFTYNREKQQNFGLLQAFPGRESNLLVIGSDGAIYSYILKYRKELKRLNYFISDSSSIGNLHPISKNKFIKEKTIDSVRGSQKNYKKFCEFLIDRKQDKPLVRKERYGVRLSVEDIVFDKEELYVVMEIHNTSKLDFDINYLETYIQTKKRGKKISMQRVRQKPVFKYHFPEKIKSRGSHRFIVVLPKFSLGKDMLFILELNEKKGERNIRLAVKNRFINNPN